MARPTDFTPKLGHQICKLIADGWSLKAISGKNGMPTRQTIHNWLLDPQKKGFFDKYTRACDVRAENMFDELLEIADDRSKDLMTIKKGKEEFNVEDREVTNRSRLRVDTRKWYLSKVLPKKFGEKLDLTSDGKALPTPIIDVTNSLNVPKHHSHQEDPEAPKEN